MKRRRIHTDSKLKLKAIPGIELFEVICPKDLEIETIRGAKLKTSFANERVRKTPKTTLKFFGET